MNEDTKISKSEAELMTEETEEGERKKKTKLRGRL